MGATRVVAKSILPAVWEIPPKFLDRLGEKAGRQRAMFADGHLLLVLHGLPQPDDTERKGRYFWRKPDGVWSSDEFGSGPNALVRHLGEYASALERLEEQDETAAGIEDYFAVLQELAPIHRASRNLHTAFQQAREMCPEDRDIINFRDRAYRIERTAELLYQDARNSLDFAIAKRTEEQALSSQKMSVSAHRLNVLAAFFFPIATLTALFGVNLKIGFEEVAPPFPFLGLLVLGLLLGYLLKLFVTR